MSTAYSGGGRQENYADFLLLDDDGSYNVAFKDIPFSSSEMIRACFSAEEYARKLHRQWGGWPFWYNLTQPLKLKV